MKRPNSMTALITARALLAMVPMSAAATEVILLDAHLDDKKPDQPIGTGGAAVGEPIHVPPSLDAIVRREPGSDVNQELELSAGPDTTAVFSLFEFLDSAEITEGIVNIRGELILGGADAFTGAFLFVRRQGSNASSFASVTLNDSGGLTLSGDGNVNQSWQGQVQLDGRNQIELQFDMDAGRYWFWFNGNPMGPPEGYAHGITEHGVGRIVTGLEWSPVDPRSVRLDGLRVVWVPGDAVFAHGFEAPAPD